MSETGEAASGRLLASGQQVREIAHAARNLLQILVSAVDMMRRQPPSSQADGQPGCILADAERRGRDEGGRLLQAIEDVMDQPQLRVAVVEDDPVIRAALARQLAEDCGHAVVGQAETGDGLVELMAEMKPDIAVFDIHLPPGRDGLDAFREGCRRAGRLVAGVAVTGDPDVGLMERASEEGLVLAYLLKPVRREAAGHQRFECASRRAVRPAPKPLARGERRRDEAPSPLDAEHVQDVAAGERRHHGGERGSLRHNTSAVSRIVIC
jgi:DNA-binding NarL/FixJ family response regulator